ncbi:MAG: NAD(P)/FAD-dependent oxidoreductase [Capnocytophaga sp.]|nr:NAD(P)/FAD-dependent oxidoreductase [Capnocytophaga sp.]
MYDVLVAGGGAAGFFTAINCAERNPELRIAILEKSNDVLAKVRISGGGRCNVTHAEFIPSELAKNYPRGGKELISPFHRFMCGDVMEWFEQRGVSLKIEEDGRVFPASNSSQTIIDCFTDTAHRLGISLFKKQNITRIEPATEGWKVSSDNDTFLSEKLVIATGSNPKIWKMLAQLGHTIVPPVPSLFTFRCHDNLINAIPGTVAEVSLRLFDLDDRPLKERNQPVDGGGIKGSMLITHWGVSGPAVLKLSAWGARVLADAAYQFHLCVDWLPEYTESEIRELFQKEKKQSKQKITNSQRFALAKRLWKSAVAKSHICEETTWAELTKIQTETLIAILKRTILHIDGKATFKEEFVTAGGVKLSEIDFKTYRSKLCPQLYLAGEVMDIDAVTGGFNFQNAWTGGYHIAEAITKKV